MLFFLRPTILSVVFLCAACTSTPPNSQNKVNISNIQNTLNTDTTNTLEPLAPTEHTQIKKLSIWEDIQQGFQLQYSQHAKIDRYVQHYSKQQRHINQVGAHANRYLHFIVSELKRRNMPMEFALLPIVESSYDPFAYSHSSASGLWQFMPKTGASFGLEQNWWYDGRRDVTASTSAALDYLEQLAKRFNNNYLLALAAYNAGGGNVNKAIRRNRKAGKPTDFWSLKLPKETQTYVPKLLALSRIVANPQQHNIQLPDIANEPYFEKVATGSQIDLAQAANLARIDITELQLLNPAFNRWATAPKGPHYLLIPEDRVGTFEQNLKKLPDTERMSWERYTIKRGDSLIKIASNYNTTTEQLKSTNNLSSNRIRAGKTLLIPVSSHASSHYNYSQVQRFKNNLRASKSTQKKQQYRVKSGDSFWKIAQKFKVSRKDLAKWNNLSPKALLKIGQTLVIWKNKKQTALSSTVKKMYYRVKKGDSLAKIAGKYNLAVSDIKHWNNALAKNKYIQPGQSIKLLVDVTQIH